MGYQIRFLLITIANMQKNKNNSVFQLAITSSFLFAELAVTHCWFVVELFNVQLPDVFIFAQF